MRRVIILSACLLLASCSTKQSGKTMFTGLDSLLTAEFRAFYFAIPEKDILYVGLFNRPPRNLNYIILKGLTLLKENNWME